VALGAAPGRGAGVVNGWLFIGMILAIVRVTRFLKADTFPPIALPREWIVNTFLRDGFPMPGPTRWLRFWQGVGHSFAYIWTCFWCMSFWVGLGVWAIVDWATALSVSYPWLIVAIGSLASGAWGMVEAEHDQRWAARDEQAKRR
jgi:hypothetical protein